MNLLQKYKEDKQEREELWPSDKYARRYIMFLDDKEFFTTTIPISIEPLVVATSYTWPLGYSHSAVDTTCASISLDMSSASPELG